MAKFGQWLIRISSSLSVPRAFSPSPRSALTTILYHRFFIRSESVESGLTRLRRQLEWLRARYTPLSATEAISLLVQRRLPAFPLIVTADDARLDLLDTYEVFEEFGIPLTIAVCVGPVDNQEPLDSTATLPRVVNCLRWYEGPVREVDLGRHQRQVVGSFALDLVVPCRTRQSYKLALVSNTQLRMFWFDPLSEFLS